MKNIKTIIAILWMLPLLLPAQDLSVENGGAAIIIANGAAITIGGNYYNKDGGRIKNSGTINIDGDWNKMSTNAVFTTNGGAVKFTGTEAHSIGGGTTVFNTLQIDAHVSLRVNTEVSQNLQFLSHHLYLWLYDLELLPGANIQNASPSKYVVTDDAGRLIRRAGSSETTFPVGTTAVYAPVSITNNGSADEYAVRVFGDVLQNGTSGATVDWYEKTVGTTWLLSDPDGSLTNPDFTMKTGWMESSEGSLFARCRGEIFRYNGTRWDINRLGTLSGSNPYYHTCMDFAELGAFTVRNRYGLFVTETGNGFMDGSKWTNAAPKIQDMLDISCYNDTLWVATGTYYPDSIWSPNVGVRSTTFLFPKDTVSLMGGFAGNENPETFDFATRDFITNETILSGDIGVPGDSLDNCYNVIGLYENKDIVIDGFSVEKGQADYPNEYWSYARGGGLNARKSNFTLRNMIFRDNYGYGGAGAVQIENEQTDCYATMRNMVFSSNRGRNGGAINVYQQYYWNQNTLNISNAQIMDNTSIQSGGGINIYYSSLIADSCHFENNISLGDAGAIYFYAPNSNVQFQLTNSTFTGNKCNGGNGSGGAIDIDAGDFFISKCNFEQNWAYVNGGAINTGIYTPSGLIEDCSFTDNSVSQYYGGAISINYSSFDMNRLVFNSNHCPCSSSGLDAGGAIYNLNNATNTIHLNNSLFYDNSASNGGAIFNEKGSGMSIANTTFTENSASINGILYLRYASVKLFNTLVWNNSGQYPVYLENDDTEPEFYYCDVEGGKAGFGGAGAGGNYGFDYDNANNMDSDPLFTNAAADNFSLSGFSPCIDNGTPTGTSGSAYPYVEQSGNDWILYYNGGSINIGEFDLAENPRMYGNTVDIGSYEAQSVSAGIALNLKALLEGPFNGTDMNTALNPSLLPLNQPYNTAPWNYAGTESVGTIPNANVVDWVLVEIRDAATPSAATSSTRLARKAAFILKDGSVVGTDGSSILQFNSSVNSNLFAIIWHRNHLGIMSATAVPLAGGIYSYDFTDAVAKAYQSGQKSINGKAVMYGGDADGNGSIETNDKNQWTTFAGTTGYKSTDFNMDSQVDNKDKNDVWTGNNTEQTKVPN